MYLMTVLEKFDLNLPRIVSATNDSGSEMKRFCEVLRPDLWEGNFRQLLYCVLAQVTVSFLHA